jgi:hypothetical protein
MTDNYSQNLYTSEFDDSEMNSNNKYFAHLAVN